MGRRKKGRRGKGRTSGSREGEGDGEKERKERAGTGGITTGVQMKKKVPGKTNMADKRPHSREYAQL